MDVEWWACGTVLIWQVRKPPINLSKTPTISRSGRWIQLYFLGCCMSLQSSLWPQAESGHHVLVARWFYDDGGFHRVFIGCGGVRITPWQCSRHKHAPLQQRVYFANTKSASSLVKRFSPHCKLCKLQHVSGHGPPSWSSLLIFVVKAIDFRISGK